MRCQSICGSFYWLKDDSPDNVARDTANHDPAKRDKPLCGMQFMDDFTPDHKNFYYDGWIYSPHNGATYNAQMTLVNHDTLDLHGYVIVPTFGESQTWTRVKSKASSLRDGGIMNDAMILVIVVIVTALAFDFVNGFHDAANSIATVVATRVLTPRQAVLWAACFNVLALFLFGTGVAKTVGSGMIDLNFVTPTVILAGLLGAIAWGLLTWWLRLPTSSSHALLGGYAGAAMFNSALTHGVHTMYQPIIASGWIRTLLFIVVAPVMGLVLAEILMKATLLAQKKFSQK